MTLFTVEHVYIAVNDSDVWSILVSDATVLCVGRNGGVCYRSCDVCVSCVHRCIALWGLSVGSYSLVCDVTVLCVGRNGGVCYRSCDVCVSCVHRCIALWGLSVGSYSLVCDVTVLCVGRNGGVCYRSCDGRVVITNVSSDGGAIGSLQRSVADITHVYCVWILTVFSSLDDVTADAMTSLSITLTVPSNNLNTICLKVWRASVTFSM